MCLCAILVGGDAVDAAGAFLAACYGSSITPSFGHLARACVPPTPRRRTVPCGRAWLAFCRRFSRPLALSGPRPWCPDYARIVLHLLRSDVAQARRCAPDVARCRGPRLRSGAGLASWSDPPLVMSCQVFSEYRCSRPRRCGCGCCSPVACAPGRSTLCIRVDILFHARKEHWPNSFSERDPPRSWGGRSNPAHIGRFRPSPIYANLFHQSGPNSGHVRANLSHAILTHQHSMV